MLLVHPDLADGWNYALTLAQGEIKYWNVLGFEIEKCRLSKVQLYQSIISAWVLATLEKNLP